MPPRRTNITAARRSTKEGTNLNGLTIGADPELFLRKGKRPVSSIGLVGGSKMFPKPMGKDGFYVLEDNVAVEFNIPPAVCGADFVSSILYARNELEDWARKLGMDLHIVPSTRFPKAQLQDPRAMVFGCDGDFNAWEKGAPNPKPRLTKRNATLRASGGHVHFGYPDAGNEMFRLRLIQANDVFLGVPAVLLDADTKRRDLYGKAGCFRPTSYGAEYRTLSNFWLTSEKYMRWVYDNAVKAYEFAKSPSNWVFLDLERENIVRAINESDIGTAEKLVEEYQIPVCT